MQDNNIFGSDSVGRPNPIIPPRPVAPVAVIILNWNGRELLREFLPQVIASCDSRVSEVIVADNGSTDGSVEMLINEFPDVRRIIFDDNYGFAEGYNRAIERVESPYVVLLNSDATGTPGWDVALYDYMETHPDTGACQPKLLSYQSPERFDYAGAAGGYLDKNGYPYCRGRIFGTCEADTGQYDADADIHWATGAALMVRRNVYIDCGGLDADFFAHMEEIDLCWRIRLAGWKIAAVGDATVYHLGGASLAVGNPRKTYLNFRNNLLMLHKNLPDSDRAGILFRRRLLDTIAWAKYVVTFQWSHAAAIVRAHRDFARLRTHYSDHPDRNLLKTDHDGRRNILVDYYLRHRKCYSDLR
ncbi:MAG: glycosyltransferase family 2 protein [Muribaculaceae bacterium]|nr:glycosyltransferase family 2 protein [Muribaculaceae bacterium]